MEWHRTIPVTTLPKELHAKPVNNFRLLFQTHNMSTVNFQALLTQATGTLQNRSVARGICLSFQATADPADKERKNTSQVTLSESGKLRAQRLNAQQSPNNMGDARKSAARAHAAQLRQQLEILKKVAQQLGPVAAKGLLRQIKRIAQQIRQIAAELAQSSAQPALGIPNAATVNHIAAGGEDLSVDDSVDFASDEETANEEEATAAKEHSETPEAPARQNAEKTKAEESVPTRDDAKTAATKDAATSANAALAQAKQAVTEAEKEIREQEREENDKGTGSNAGIVSKQRDAARVRQEDAAMLRDLLKDFRLVLGLVKSLLRHQDKEDKKNLEEIDRQLKATDDLVHGMEISAYAQIQGVDTGAEAAVSSISVFV
jgi:hypothetical protein